MSIQSEINRLKQNVSAAFTAIGNKGGTVPSSKVSGNLATAIQSIPEGVTVQRKTGSFKFNGSAASVNQNCGFCPDVVFIHLPDAHTQGGKQYVNDMCANLYAVEIGVIIMGSAYIGELYGEYWLAFGYIQKTENGFIASNFGEQELSGNYWYTAKEYQYTAIKYT